MRRSVQRSLRLIDRATLPLRRALHRTIRRMRRVWRDSIEQSGRSVEAFYATSPTCQVPNLGFLYELFLGQRTNGYFVEVGAFDGISFSNSSALAGAGWAGLLIEPVPELAAQCRVRYAANDRIVIEEVAAGDSTAPVELTIAGPLTTVNSAIMSEYAAVGLLEARHGRRSVTVAQCRLDELLERHAPPMGVDVLIVDVEGYESAVFAGLSLDRWLPRMMIVELADTHPRLATTRVCDAMLCRDITECGYHVVYKDSINTVFVHDGLWNATYRVEPAI